LLPQVGNRTRLLPESDWIITANTVIEGDVAPDRAPLPSADFDTPHRAQRIAELLAARSDWTLEDMVSVQMDIRSSFALEIVSLIGAGPWEGRAADSWRLLEDWDGTMQGNGAPALFALLERQLHDGVLDELAGLQVGRIDSRKNILRVLRGGASADWFDVVATDVRESRADALQLALARAWNDAVTRWGDDPQGWDYGSIHRLHLENPVGTVPVLGRWLNRGPMPWPGSETTVAAFGTGRGESWQTIAFGPSMRWISDPADPDRSLVVIPGGQSGHPFDPHYVDQIEAYGQGEIRPVPWSREKAEQGAISSLRLIAGER
jgi:penicillin amidase